MIAPLRRVAAWFYSYSLGLVLALLFLLSFGAHLQQSVRKATEEALWRHAPPPSLWEHLTSATFWFESLQNWQSEFLAVASMVALSIYLRQRGSPESKPVGASHDSTGVEG